MKTTLTIKQIMAIADFAGLVIDEEKSLQGEDVESFLSNEFTISENEKVDLEDGTYYEGMTAHCTEYPEEGYLQLEDKEPKPKDSNCSCGVRIKGM